MPFHNHELFESREDIPDIVPGELILPKDLEHIFVPKAPQHGAETTTPVEVGFVFYKCDPRGFPAEKQMLEGLLKRPDQARDFWVNERGSHLGRVIMKTMLDPDRFAPVNLSQVYRKESRLRGYSTSEMVYFDGFLQNWGVLQR